MGTLVAEALGRAVAVAVGEEAAVVGLADREAVGFGVADGDEATSG
ncbi:MAG TPA: hypothetical protein VGR09_11085 [Gemmatimonadales bacterium]|nr:hypothetical protein [Gemmatimonadales bacterium]